MFGQIQLSMFLYVPSHCGSQLGPQQAVQTIHFEGFLGLSGAMRVQVRKNRWSSLEDHFPSFSTMRLFNQYKIGTSEAEASDVSILNDHRDLWSHRVPLDHKKCWSFSRPFTDLMWSQPFIYMRVAIFNWNYHYFGRLYWLYWGAGQSRDCPTVTFLI